MYIPRDCNHMEYPEQTKSYQGLGCTGWVVAENKESGGYSVVIQMVCVFTEVYIFQNWSNSHSKPGHFLLCKLYFKWKSFKNHYSSYILNTKGKKQSLALRMWQDIFDSPVVGTVSLSFGSQTTWSLVYCALFI